MACFTTRLPDGSKGYSLLIIISVEFDPPVQLILGFSLAGVGGYLGINRTVDVNVLREGLHNRTLDAILFPKDPVINAPRIINTLRSVFPPARGRHLFGLAVIIGWGPSTPLITVKLAVIYEHGDNPRLIILGQIEMMIPAKKPILEIHMDAIGIWDYDKSEFSLDARLYNSRIAFITISGDMALRVRRGANPFFMLSIGGYHPAFNVPPDFPKLERVIIKFGLIPEPAPDPERLFRRHIQHAPGRRENRLLRQTRQRQLRSADPDSTCSGNRTCASSPTSTSRSPSSTKAAPCLARTPWDSSAGPTQASEGQGQHRPVLLLTIAKSFDKTFGDDRPPAQLPRSIL